MTEQRPNEPVPPPMPVAHRKVKPTEDESGSPTTTERAKDQAQEVAGQAQDKVQQVAGPAKDKVQQVAGQAKDQAKQRVATQLDERSTQVGRQITAQADTVDGVAERLRSQGQETPARVVEQAGQKLRDVGEYLENTDGETLAKAAADVARENPAAAAAVGAAAGLAAGRVIKASREDSTVEEDLPQPPASPAGSSPLDAPAPVSPPPPAPPASSAPPDAPAPASPPGAAPLGGPREPGGA